MEPNTEKLTEALLKPESYPTPVDKIELVQTHISFVFLTGNYVYKVKKPVDFGFLDFTTLEKRRFYCYEELRVNDFLAGDIYIDVVPIVQTPEGKIQIHGDGETIDYAVKMIQLPKKSMMNSLLDEGNVSKVDMEKIAEKIAEFHAQAPTSEDIDKYGSLKQVKENWIQNFEQTRNLRGEILGDRDFEYLEGKIMSYMNKNASIFNTRVEKGKIKECHGDIHSQNIFIVKKGTKHYNKGIYIFDAIEFNKEFKYSDVTAEVAFLAMDLEYRGEKELSNHFIENYVKASRDEEVLNLLDFYKCYRAYVRSKVASFKLSDPHINEEEKTEAKRLTRDYFNLALRYGRKI